MSKHSLIMARPKQIDDEALLDSLSATFLELGPGASTQELARRAGVSEGTLFKRFGSKSQLFIRALRLPPLIEQPWFAHMFERVGRGSLEEHMLELTRGLLVFVGLVLPRLHTIQANGKLKPQEVARMMSQGANVSPAVLISTFQRFFALEIEAGRLRQTDPRALASFFVGAIIHNCHLRLYFPDFDPRSETEFARWLVRSFLELAAPRRP